MNAAEDEPTPAQHEIQRLAADPEFRREALHFALRAVRRYGLPESAAEDICQSAMLKLLQKSWWEPGIEHPRSYMFVVVLNEARRLYHKETGRLQKEGYQPVPLDDVDVASTIPDPLEDAQHMESMLLLREVMQCLDEDERLLFELWLDGYSSRDIAKEMHLHGKKISHTTVAALLKLIRKKVKTCILG